MMITTGSERNQAPKLRALLCIVVCAIAIASMDTLHAQWIKVPAISDRRVSSLLQFDSLLFAATLDSLVYKSTDDGLNWTRSSVGIVEGAASNDLIRYGTNLYVNTLVKGVYRSTDAGVTWLPFGRGLEGGYVDHIEEYADDLYACSSLGLFRLVDEEWRRVGGGLTSNVYTIAGSSEYLFAGTNGKGLFRSQDSGLTWLRVDTDTTRSLVLCILVRNNIVLASFAGLGVFRSSDYGNSWSVVTSGLTKYRDALTIMDVGDFFLAGTQNGVYQSTDLGITWVTVNEGLPQSANTSVYDFCVVGDYLFLASVSRGVWQRPLRELLPPSEVTMEVRSGGAFLSEAVPNPVTSSTWVAYRTTTGGHIGLKLYTYSGQEVAVLVDEPKEAGTYRVHLDASSLPSGIYYYCLTTGATSLTQRLVVMK